MSKKKPVVKLIGENGNIFNLMAISRKALVKAGMKEEAEEMVLKITETAKSYDEALRIIMDYLEVK